MSDELGGHGTSRQPDEELRAKSAHQVVPAAGRHLDRQVRQIGVLLIEQTLGQLNGDRNLCGGHAVIGHNQHPTADHHVGMPQRERLGRARRSHDPPDTAWLGDVPHTRGRHQ
ncbi:hypothetical protein [Actinomadura rupiterrae]|uniref:hypothetical protein n=1 Tax=Actinomadura rupiterrae TaxID=559627 RepID=UPI0020A59852|nr:hypothetical protein [Actinomadura rupiterrae]MCP2341178.1 hypothetical protein [Actinomadura rupiterrae]